MANSSLQTLIDQRKSEAFVDPSGASDEDALGLLISVHFEWDGVSILKTAISALEDANFHTEAALIEDMLKKVEAQ